MARNPNPAPPRPPVDIDADTGEVTERPDRRELAKVSSEFGGDDARGFTLVKHVTVPMLSDKEVPPGRPIVVRFVDAMRVLPPIEGVKPRFPGEHMASTIEAPSGDVRLFTWSTVFRKEMDRDYPDGTYVGKWFRITRLPQQRTRSDVAFWPWAIAEVAPS